jgi:hypothetical protein
MPAIDPPLRISTIETSEFRFGGREHTPPPDQIGALAYQGLAGETVRQVELHTEADGAALLLTLLVIFGNVVGRSPHFLVSGTKHHANLFLGLVGPTAAGRKGSAYRAIALLFRSIQADWYRNCVNSGLSSGEGIIWAVRDRVWEQRATRNASGEIEASDVLTDEGVEDKRLLVIQEEFASALKAMDRQGNTLSALLRQSWDHSDLRTMTKNPMRATEPHISVISHIGKPELIRNFSTTESANGLGNRFLWAWVRRSKYLPHGGCFDDNLIRPLAQRLAAAVNFAQGIGQMIRSPEANEIWEAEYQRLSAERPGLFGSMIARAAPQVLRLSMNFALLDHVEIITADHLLAAMEVWRFCEESVRFIFGGRLGDPIADQILEAMRDAGDGGMTRSDINGLLGRNRPAHEIEAALQVLLDNGLATWLSESTEGRPVQRWFTTDLSTAGF